MLAEYTLVHWISVDLHMEKGHAADFKNKFGKLEELRKQLKPRFEKRCKKSVREDVFI